MRGKIMANVKTKAARLFSTNKNGLIELHQLNTELGKLINLKTKNAALKYDVNIKLAKAVQKALSDFQDIHKKAIETVEIKEGEQVTDEQSKTLGELLNAALADEVELNCYQIKLSRLSGEDISEINLLAVEDFILNDLEPEA
jgi:hypothetical protein